VIQTKAKARLPLLLVIVLFPALMGRAMDFEAKTAHGGMSVAAEWTVLPSVSANLSFATTPSVGLPQRHFYSTGIAAKYWFTDKERRLPTYVGLSGCIRSEGPQTSLMLGGLAGARLRLNQRAYLIGEGVFFFPVLGLIEWESYLSLGLAYLL
jgi:hypothetical protein